MSFFARVYVQLKYEKDLLKMRSKFKKLNKHNTMYLNIGNRIDNIKIGNYSYGDLNIYDYNDGCKLIIGNFCSIAKNVYFILGGDHHYNRICTYPFKAKFSNEHDSFSKGDIIVGDDVWIGFGATILSGVKIGQGAVIAAGSVVTKNVEPYSIVGGSPAKFIKWRFSKEIIDEAMKIDYSKINREFYLNNKDVFYVDCSVDNVRIILDTIASNIKNN